MAQRLFISHCGVDNKIAKLFSNTLRKITLEQISPWFSSDDNRNGGLNQEYGLIKFLIKLTKVKLLFHC